MALVSLTDKDTSFLNHLAQHAVGPGHYDTDCGIAKKLGSIRKVRLPDKTKE
jgi:hypothetical protein